MAVELDTDGNKAIDISLGGTNAKTAGEALFNLGGQPYDADLDILSSGSFSQKRALIEAFAKPVLGVDALRTTMADFDGDCRYLAYHTTDGDGGYGAVRWDSASTSSDDGGTIFAVSGVPTGRWKRIIGPNGSNPCMFGAVANGVTDDYDAVSAWAATITDNSYYKFPAKNFALNGNIEISGATNFTIDLSGAVITQQGTNNTTFTLNSGALQDESIMENHIEIVGGILTNSTAYTANANIGINTRGTVFVTLENIRFIGFGTEAVLVGVRDSLWVKECTFYNNTTHILQDLWATTQGNPQLIFIDKCVFSVFDTSVGGIVITGAPNDFYIAQSTFVYSNSIVAYTGSESTAGAGFRVENCSFEQGSVGEYYIRTDYQNSRQLNNVIIQNNTFNDSTCKVLQLEGVDTAIISGNKINSNVSGCIDIDANCEDITFGTNQFPNIASFTQGISYACSRDEILFLENEKIIPAVAYLAGWSGAALSTDTGTIDMSAVTGSNWTPLKLIPPRAYIFQVRCRDTASSSSAAKFLMAKDSGVNAADMQGIYLQGVTNNVYRTHTVVVPCDDSGDVYYSATASGSGTLEVRITLIGWIR